MPTVFRGFNLADFWEISEYANTMYVDHPPIESEIHAIERELGYTLPKAYIELARYGNGGLPRKTCHAMREQTSWAPDHIKISGIFSIGRTKPWSLCGEMGSQFFMDEWGYPPIGVYFASCPSAGHDMICLDYRACGSTGEPQVVHVDQEFDYAITFVAESFEAFIRGLRYADEFAQ